MLADYAECLFDKGLARDATAADTLARLQDRVAAYPWTYDGSTSDLETICCAPNDGILGLRQNGWLGLTRVTYRAWVPILRLTMLRLLRMVGCTRRIMTTQAAPTLDRRVTLHIPGVATD